MKFSRNFFNFIIFENTKKQFFLGSLLGLIGMASAGYLSHTLIFKYSAGLLVLGIAGYLLFTYKQKKWLKYMHEKR